MPCERKQYMHIPGCVLNADGVLFVLTSSLMLLEMRTCAESQSIMLKASDVEAGYLIDHRERIHHINSGLSTSGLLCDRKLNFYVGQVTGILGVFYTNVYCN